MLSQSLKEPKIILSKESILCEQLKGNDIIGIPFFVIVNDFYIDLTFVIVKNQKHICLWAAIYMCYKMF